MKTDTIHLLIWPHTSTSCPQSDSRTPPGLWTQTQHCVNPARKCCHNECCFLQALSHIPHHEKITYHNILCDIQIQVNKLCFLTPPPPPNIHTYIWSWQLHTKCLTEYQNITDEKLLTASSVRSSDTAPGLAMLPAALDCNAFWHLGHFPEAVWLLLDNDNHHTHTNKMLCQYTHKTTAGEPCAWGVICTKTHLISASQTVPSTSHLARITAHFFISHMAHTTAHFFTSHTSRATAHFFTSHTSKATAHFFTSHTSKATAHFFTSHTSKATAHFFTSHTSRATAHFFTSHTSKATAHFFTSHTSKATAHFFTSHTSRATAHFFTSHTSKATAHFFTSHTSKATAHFFTSHTSRATAHFFTSHTSKATAHFFTSHTSRDTAHFFTFYLVSHHPFLQISSG